MQLHLLIARAAFGATEVLLGKPIPCTSLDRHSLFSSSSASVSGVKLRTDVSGVKLRTDAL